MELASLLTLDVVARMFPAAETVGTALEVLCGLACTLFLWKLTPVLREYRTAALCQIAVTFVNLFLLALPEGSALVLLLGIPAIVLGFYGNYVEFHTHAQAVEPLDAGLAAGWRKLWKLLLLSLGSLVLLIFSMLLGPGAVVLAGLAVLGLTVYYAVMRMVYLWRTAKCFREWTPPALPESSPSPDL